MYLVLVEGTGTTVYNPMIVSAGYDEQSVLQDGSVDSAAAFNQTGYAKSTNITVDKSIVEPGSGNVNGDDLGVGDTVNFKIESVIPSYSEDYESIVYNISDKLNGGLILKAEGATYVTVKVNGVETAEAADTFTFTKTNDEAFVIAFAEDFVRAHGSENVEVTYKAELTETSLNYVNFDAMTNEATVEFTNSPDPSQDAKKISDKTYQYTFAIDAMLGGSEKGKTTRTREVVKIKDDGSVTVVENQEEILDEVNIDKPLANAEFTLTETVAEGETPRVYTAKTDASGYLEIKGLDAGTYTLVETKAPSGYTLDPTPITVVISANYNEDGTLKSYSVTMQRQGESAVATSTYTATYDGPETITEIQGETETLAVKNTKIPNLPSTGGMGTYGFTLAGALFLSAAAALFVQNSRMSKKEN